jgi:regulator of nucleoside diphosphate kinase
MDIMMSPVQENVRRRAAMGWSNTTITDRDRCRLARFLDCEATAAIGNPRMRFNLELTLEQARTIAAESAPPWLVTMNSTVVLSDVTSGEHMTCTLVYPEDRDLIPNSVGVLQRLGQCLLGRCVGDIFHIQEGKQLRSYCIESLPYQPEAAGHTHL